MFEIIAFDADDTLWDNEIYYIQAKQEFIKLLASYDNDVEWIERRLDEIEEGNVEIYGYGIKSFTLSMIEAAIEFSRGVISGDELEKIIYIGRRMLNTRVRLFPHTEQVLQVLDKKWRLMLITKGDVFEQSLKIERTGLKEYFRYIEIVGAKTASIYNTVFERYRLDPKRVLMVGNSLRSDILPILELGGVAVYIPYENTWAHEHIELHDIFHNGYYELENLGQLPNLLNEIKQRKGKGQIKE
jgi:putative hydrolase of the HAD superfamily